jgi:hypothetical protein
MLRYPTLISLSVVVMVGCSLRGMLTPMPLNEYRGDGSISRINFIPNPGVLIEFAPFQISSAFQGEYRLAGLPRRPFPYIPVLVVPYPDDYELPTRGELFNVPGTLELRLLRSDGSTVFECQGVPGWSAVFGGTFSNAEAGFASCGGDRGEKPYILPEDIDAGNDMVLKVAWAPSGGPAGVKGWLKLQSGGTK